ncbi:MAG: tRNA glutamyl-Q(34) synthetase GluQRS [Rhizobiaceae bacterium]
MTRPVYRFAPTPNGLLHLGHVRSAVLNHDLARVNGGRFLLRIEDIDLDRADPRFEQAIYEDLAWLGLSWETPVRRQSAHLADYRAALARLEAMALVYPAFLTRGEIRARIAEAEADGRDWPRDPDGSPLYPGDERQLGRRARLEAMASGKPYALRLDMAAAIAATGGTLSWQERGAGPRGESGTIVAEPARWGDVVVARRDAPGSYHLAVVVDDAGQGVTEIVRGADLFHATSVHRLLQQLLGLPVPSWRHHGLVLGSDGRKLSKSRGDLAVRALRAAGHSPGEVREMAQCEPVTAG